MRAVQKTQAVSHALRINPLCVLFLRKQKPLLAPLNLSIRNYNALKLGGMSGFVGLSLISIRNYNALKHKWLDGFVSRGLISIRNYNALKLKKNI